MLIEKIIGVFCSAVISLNIGMPIFAYSSIDSHAASNDDFEVSVSKDASADKLMNIDLGNEKISLSLDQKTSNFAEFKCEQENKSEKLSKGQTQQITNILPEVSVRYKKQEQGLKEDFILHSRAAQNVFDLNYDIGSLQAQQLDEQNILLTDENGNIKTIISAPYMTNAKGSCSTDVTLKILDKKDNILSVKLTADYSWLQSGDREYPVEVDPRYDTLPTKPMQKGDNSEQVALLKNMLFEAGIGAGVSWHEVKRDMRNNTFSNVTERFVIAFQREMDLTPTGVADANTLAALRNHLERKGILDTKEHTEQFLRRAEERSPSETKGFFAGIADFFSRINLTDLLVTAGTVAVVAGISAFCAPVTAAGVAYMLIGGAAIGATANGISEYAQQRAVGSDVDFGRVAIKAAGGAVKGLISAIPGAGVGVGGNALLFGGVAAARTAENLSCTVKSTGFSGEALGDALLNGAAQGLVSIPAAALARGVVSLVKPQPSANLLSGTKPAQIGKAKEIAEGVGAVGGSAVAESVANSVSGNKSDKSSSTTRDTPESSKTSTEPGSKNLMGGSESRQIGRADRFGEDAAEVTVRRTVSTDLRNTEAKSDSTPANFGAVLKNDVVEKPSTPCSLPTKVSQETFGTQMCATSKETLSLEMQNMQQFMNNQAHVDPSKPIDQVIDEKWQRTVEGTQIIHEHCRTPQGLEMQKEIYKKDLEFVSGVREFAGNNGIKLTPETEHKLGVFERMAHGEIQVRDAARRGDVASQHRLNFELTRDPREVMTEQVRRYTEEFCRQLHNLLVNMYS